MIPKIPKLEVGKTCFVCTYHVRNLPIPKIETWIYLGTNLFKEDKGSDTIYHYFERPENYLAAQIQQEQNIYNPGVIDDEQSKDQCLRKLRVEDKDLEALVYDYDGLQEWIEALAEEPNADKVF